MQTSNQHPWFGAFFTFGTAMCVLTVILLVFPGTKLDILWRLNPEAHSSLQSLKGWSVLLMAIVGAACALAATGVWSGKRWGIRLALVILVINVTGDIGNTIVRHDYRALIGVPIAGAMIVYLMRSKAA